jgi:hypothetical protein
MSAARPPGEEEEEDEDESNLSLAAMEAELRPQVMETLDVIAETYKKLRKLQDQQVENRLPRPARCRRPGAPLQGSSRTSSSRP